MFTSVHASTPSHSAPSSSAPLGEERLEWRHLQSHDVPLISPRVQWLLAGGMGLLVLAYVAWMLQRAWPVLSQLDWQTLSATWWHKAREKEANWLVLVYPVLMAGILGQRWLWGRHLRLYVSAQGLRQEHRLPLGLHHLLGQNWQVDWSDVREITTRRASTTNGLVQPMAAVEIVLRLGAGPVGAVDLQRCAAARTGHAAGRALTAGCGCPARLSHCMHRTVPAAALLRWPGWPHIHAIGRPSGVAHSTRSPA